MFVHLHLFNIWAQKVNLVFRLTIRSLATVNTSPVGFRRMKWDVTLLSQPSLAPAARTATLCLLSQLLNVLWHDVYWEPFVASPTTSKTPKSRVHDGESSYQASCFSFAMTDKCLIGPARLGANSVWRRIVMRGWEFIIHKTPASGLVNWSFDRHSLTVPSDLSLRLRTWYILTKPYHYCANPLVEYQ